MLPGVFKVPVTGVWRVSFSLVSQTDTKRDNYVFIYHNQHKIGETVYHTYSEHYVYSTGGRELITKAKRGDTFYLGTEKMDDEFYKIITCFEFISL